MGSDTRTPQRVSQPPTATDQGPRVLLRIPFPKAMPRHNTRGLRFDRVTSTRAASALYSLLPCCSRCTRGSTIPCHTCLCVCARRCIHVFVRTCIRVCMPVHKLFHPTPLCIDMHRDICTNMREPSVGMRTADTYTGMSMNMYRHVQACLQAMSVHVISADYRRVRTYTYTYVRGCVGAWVRACARAHVRARAHACASVHARAAGCSMPIHMSVHMPAHM